MTRLLARLFVKDYGQTDRPTVRAGYGKLAGAVGIVTNILLFGFKLLAGILSGSVAIIADSVNNLSDSCSSIITIVGFKMAEKPADKEHPYGHARSEYVSGLIVSIIIVTIGVQLGISSVEKTITPSGVSFSWLTITILVLSILVKFWQSFFYRSIGRKIDSKTLIATAADSRNDVLSTAAVLLSVLIMRFTEIDIDGYIGLLVAVFIIYSGIRLVVDMISPLLGSMPEETLVRKIREKLLSYDGVLGIHDLVIHSYGYGRCFASVHVEVANTESLVDSHDRMDNIERDFACDMDIQLVIHTDPVILDDEAVNQTRLLVNRLVKSIDETLSTHDFRMVTGATHTNLIFDIEVPTEYPLSDDELRHIFERLLAAIDETYRAIITIDRSYIPSTKKRAQE